MIMELPEKFTYKDYAKVEGGVLYLERKERIEDVMYELTYALREPVCIYCGRRLKRKDCTIDHRFPRSTGGVSIVNNLFIACAMCNSKKGDYLHREFLQLRKLHKKGKGKLAKKISAKKKKKIKRSGFILPGKWTKIIDISEIKCRGDQGDYSRKKRYYRIVEFWNRYHKLPRPVILDKNKVLLDGYNIIVVARDLDIKTIPAIILENVEVVEK